MAAMIDLRPRKLPPAAAFFIPEGLSDLSLLYLLRTVAGELISVYSVGIRRRNERLLVRRIAILMELFEGASNSCCEAPRRLSRLAVLCLKEIYIVVHRTRILLEYCAQASRLWLILRGSQIAGEFCELDREISVLLEVLPLDEFYLAADVQEHVELLQRQVGVSSARGAYLNSKDEDLRKQILCYLKEFETGQPPNASNLKSTFVEQIGISKARDLEFEIAFLEEQIIICEKDAEYDLGIVADAVALARFCRFLLYGLRVKDENKKKKRISPEVYSISAPKDFCCPISLDLMRDPVVVSTGQTYDRYSISCWLDGGSRICPNSGQVLDSAALVPNLALRSLISQWSAANDLLYESEGTPDGIGETMSKAAVEAIRATARILIGHLSNFNEESKAIAARELHMLAKIGKKSRAVLAEEGGIPLLCRLLSSPNSLAQENAMTALLNLTMLDENRRRIIEEQGCLSLIVMLLRRGSTAEAKENAVAALLSLSAVTEYKKKIVGEVGGLEMLAWFLRKGSPRGRKDAGLALFNLATQPESWERMVESGAVSAMVCALEDEEVAEVVAGAIGMLAREPVVAGMVGWEERAVVGLVEVMRNGSLRGRENATTALHQICCGGGELVANRLARMPGLVGVVHVVARLGTNRARRKALGLARMLQKAEPLVGLRGTEWREEQVMGRSSEMASIPVAISVPVL